MSHLINRLRELSLLIFSLWMLQSFAVPLQVMEVTERSFDNAPGLVVVFSEPLDPTTRYDTFLNVTKEGQLIEGGWVVGDNPQLLFFPHVLPNTSYTVTILAGLPARTGHQLAQVVSKKITTKTLEPALGFASQGLILPAELTSGLPIIVVNVEAVDIEFFRVKQDKVPEFIETFQKSSSKVYWELDEFHSLAESVYLGRFNTQAPPNKRTVSHIPVENISQLREPGLYVAVMKAPGRYDYEYQTAYFFVSDIGLHARRYGQNRFEMYASSLRTGQPLSKVELTLYVTPTEQLKEGIFAKTYTNDQGGAFFESFPQNVKLLTAQYGSHVSFLFLNDPALDLSEFSMDGLRAQPLELFIYTPRDLYRPGESINFSALLRNEDGQAVLNPPLQAKIKRPDGREVHHFVWQPETLGYYAQVFNLPKDAQTGEWSLEVSVEANASTPLQVYTFKVEEFLPERMKLTLKSPQEYLQPKEELNINVKGDYLYGAPAAHQRVTASLHVHPHRHPVEAFPDFYFGTEGETLRNDQENVIDQTLDQDGQLTFHLSPLQENQIPSLPLEVKTVVSLYETGGRPMSRSLQRMLWPAPELIGIRPLFDLERAPGKGQVQFEVIKVNFSGELIVSPDLQVQLVQEDREYYWNYTTSSGWKMDYRKADYSLQRLNLKIPSKQRINFTLPIGEGHYRLEILDPETKLTTTLRFQTAWYGDEDTQGAARPDKVTLHLDKASYRPGDIIKLKVLSPHPGEGVIVVENRDQSLWSTHQSISEQGRVIEIPVDPTWQQHDIYLSAIVLRPGVAKDKMTPNRAIGLIHLPLERNERRLALQMTVPEKISPQQPLDIHIKVDHLHNQPAMVTVAAVDVGVLNLTEFTPPDPYAHFFAKRRYSVDMYDVYGQVIESLEGVTAKSRFGGDAALAGGKRPDAKVKIISLFTGPVRLDAQGEAHISLPISDFNGRLKVMAVAFSENQFAATDSEVTVVSPLVAEISTPRFLASKDQSFLTLEVHNLSGHAQVVQAHLKATPPLVLDELGIPLTLANQEKVVLTLPLRGEENFGVGQIQLALQGNEMNLKRQWELGVRPAYPGERQVLRQALSEGGLLKIDPHLAETLMPKTVDIDLVVSTQPPINVRSAFKYLLNYPYGCLEQTTSTAYPLIYVDKNMARQLEIEPITEEERRKRIEGAFARLSSMQKANGGFGLWDNQSPEEDWLTPYVINFLLDAQEQGFTPPELVLQQGLKRLLERLQSTYGETFSVKYQNSHQDEFAAKVFAGYVLSRLGQAPLSTLRTLYDHHLKVAQAPLPLAHLGLALYLQGDRKRGVATLDLALHQPYMNSSGYHGDYGSELRDLALLIHLLHKHKIQELTGREQLWPRLNDLLQKVLWYSTQERNALFLSGLSVVQSTSSQQREITLIVGTDQKEDIHFKNRWQHRFTVDALRSGIQVATPQTLYTELEITGYPQRPPQEEKGPIVLERGLYTLGGEAIKDRPLHVGELLLVFLSLTGGEEWIENGLLVDLLPAGLELENPHLMPAETLEELEVDGIDLNEAMEKQKEDIKYQEYRDDRFISALRLEPHHTMRLFYLARVVTPGTYTLPAPYFEDMYRPNLRVIGKGGGRLQIKNHP